MPDTYKLQYNGMTLTYPGWNGYISFEDTAIPRNVILNQQTGGTIAVTPMSGYDGDVVTLSNTPDAGYKFVAYSVTGATLTGNTFAFDGSDVNVQGSFDIDILALYPVGTLYKSVNANFNPNTVFGGTWVLTKLQGRTPVGKFISSTLAGGEKTHTLTMAECPSHNHSFSRVLFGTFGNDKMTTGWNNYRSNAGTSDKVANGNFSTTNSTNAATHNNIQPSMICKIWERTA
jgi:microcystin-dependent protein